MANSKFFQQSQRKSVQVDPSSHKGRIDFEFHSSLVQLLIDSKNLFFNLEQTLQGVINPNINIDPAKKENYKNILERVKAAGQQSDEVYHNAITSEKSRPKTST